MKQLFLAALSAITLFSCVGNKNISQPYKAGIYIIDSVIAKEVYIIKKPRTDTTFYFVQGRFNILCDTLKTGDTIRLNIIKYKQKPAKHETQIRRY